MDPAFAAIETYFTEARRQWTRQADRALSRAFFALWQEVQQTRPFRLADDEVPAIQGVALDLAEDTDRVAAFLWDAENECPALVVEGRTLSQRVLLMLADGEPLIEEQPPVFRDDEEVSYGERLDIILDIVDRLRRTAPGEIGRASCRERV